MALLNWNKRLSVGVESIDDQHKILVDTLNELHHAVMQGETRNSTAPLLRSLLAYTRNHHAAEERMMTNVNYPELKQHQSLHRELVDSLQGFLASIDRGETAINVDSLYRLRDGLTNHIQRVDGGYRAWFAEHGEPLRIEAMPCQASNVSWIEAKSGAGFGSEERS
jgi:hemerythrin-like metal-binding protein